MEEAMVGSMYRARWLRPVATAVVLTCAATLGAAPAAASTAGTGRNVAVRALVVAVNATDWGEATWRATLDRVGAAYDVLHSATTPLTEASLVRADGTGRYNAILLTNGMQLAPGDTTSGLDPDEWNRLWAYERQYGVRQATLSTSYGTWPEDYCLENVTEGPTGSGQLPATLTDAGAGVFDYLRRRAVIPITESYVYRNRIRAGCAAEPVLVVGNDVLGVRTTTPDGRERLALSVSSQQYLLHAHLLVYGLFRWASRGLHLGAQRHYLNVDIDDWYNASAHLYPDGRLETNPGFRVSGHDVFNLRDRQARLRYEHPLLDDDFAFTLAYNGWYSHRQTGGRCSRYGGLDALVATTRCLADDFRWINHTYKHPQVNFTDYATNRSEIEENLRAAAGLGLPDVPTDILKTGEYSGLGVYHDDPKETIKPPVDHGLGASNQALLAAARDLGVRFLHGNMSFASHRPPCFNCGTPHPLEPRITIVADWPTGLGYHTTTAEEQTYFYNTIYGPGGMTPQFPEKVTYQQMLERETGEALNHLATGSIHAHTLHIANVRDYGGGRTLATDWLDRLITRYESYYSVPLLSPDWSDLAELTVDRNAHFAAVTDGVDAVLDRAAGTVTVTAPTNCTFTLSGIRSGSARSYGRETAATISLSAGGQRTLQLYTR